MITTIITILSMLVNDNIDTSYIDNLNIKEEITSEVVNLEEPDEIEKIVNELTK